MDLQKAAVVGYPIGHTMSPFIHKRLFALSAIPCEYTVCQMEDLKAGWETLCGLDVFNVTIPHKERIIHLLDALDEKAVLFGSVNTVQIKNGHATGYTTDGFGFLKALDSEQLLPKGKILLLGNGGAARAIAFEITLSGKADALTFVCREPSLQKTETLKADLLAVAQSQNMQIRANVLTYQQAEAQDLHYDLLVNTTSVGMHPHVQACPVSEALVKKCGAVFDAVYNPEKTMLLQFAEKNGIPAVGGMDMLVYQAVAAHEIWYGSKFDSRQIKALCTDATAEMERIFSGKNKTETT